MDSQSKITEALEFLNREAKEKREEIYRLISEKYSNIKEIMTGAVTSGEEKVKEVVTGVDKKVHEKPWLFIGIAALAGFLLGYVIEGCRRSK